MRVLALNVGSSTVKWVVFGEGLCVENHGSLRGGPSAMDDDALRELVGGVDRIAHRVVHGGTRRAPARIDAELLGALDELVPLAPLHLPPALAMIRRTLAATSVPQIACFDTQFHATLPEVAARLPLPDAIAGLGVRRYGFHGLSYEHVRRSLGTPPPRRVIALHLGAGASACAMLDGVSIDTSMGMTPTGGFAMGTRSGDLDPGVLFHLARHHGFDVAKLEHLVEHESGLLGIGGTADMRELLARRADDPRARLAIDVFVYGVKKTVGAYAAALGGLDVLVFTGGIGEHAAEIRDAITTGLGFLGEFTVLVVAADEERVMASYAVAM